MSVQIALNTERDVTKLKGKTRNVRLQLNDFRLQTLTSIANSFVIPEIKKRMKSAKYPQEVIDGTFVEGIELSQKKWKIKIKSEHILDSGYDLAASFEFGTKPSPGRYVPAIDARLTNPDNPSFGMHPGTKAHEIIKDTLLELKTRVQGEYKRREKIWLSQNFR